MGKIDELMLIDLLRKYLIFLTSRSYSIALVIIKKMIEGLGIQPSVTRVINADKS